jgi:hypothetical protein
MNDLDRLTMEMFMNKKSYHRFIEKTDPKKYDEHQKYLRNMRKYREKIGSITQQYLENPDLQLTTEMDQMFADYCKTCVKYFQMKDGASTEDILFDPESMNDDA